MKKLASLLCALLLLSGFAGAGQWINLTPYTQPTSVQVKESTDSRILLDLQVNGYLQSDISINGENYAFIGLADESRIWAKGAPELPRLCRSVIIPDQARMAARVVSSSYTDIANVKIAPSKGHLPRTVNPDDVPFEFSSVYQRDAWYPENVVELRDPYILRDLRGQVVEVNAFQYNPVRQVLRVHTNLTIEVAAVGVGGANVLERSQPVRKMDPNYRFIYQRHFVNYFDDRYTPVDEIGPMLVITYDGFLNAIMPFVDWKNQKGLPTQVVSVSSIGNNSTAIKNYITNLYNSTAGLAYVLLVGDNAQVTSWMIGSAGCDPVYGQIVGSDHYPELFVGRFSAENAAQVDLQVLKAVEYEKMPQAGAAWYAKALGIASNQGVGAGHYGEGDWQHMNLIRGDLLRYGFTQVDSVYDPWGTQAMIANYVNNGRSMINYCGHGSTTSWGTTGFSNSSVNALANENMLPVITSVACVNGNFTNSTCFAETWLRASHNGEPSGAIGFWGSSQNQSWAPPMYAQDEYIDLLTEDTFYNYGALCFNGSMLMIDMTGSTGNSEADHWNVFGDPSLQLRTAAPTGLTTTHPSSVTYGQTTFQITVAGTPGALAALASSGILLGYGYANESGLATLNLTWQPSGNSATVTVTRYNSTPYISNIPIVGGGVPSIDITLTPINPPIQIPAAGGSFNFNLALANNAGSAYSFDVWIMQQIPGGTWQGPMLGPVVLTMQAGATITRTRTQNVPRSAAPGTYTYCGYVGDYANVKWDSSSFTYTKLSSGDGLTIGDWDNYGESFDMNESIAASQPPSFSLSANPNPFNPTTALSYQLSAAGYVSLRVYDTAGRLVAELVNGWRDAGTHEAIFDATHLTSGIYLYHLAAGGNIATGKMVLVK